MFNGIFALLLLKLIGVKIVIYRLNPIIKDPIVRSYFYLIFLTDLFADHLQIFKRFNPRSQMAHSSSV